MHDDDDEPVDEARVIEQGRQLVASIINLALAVPAGGDARWDKLLVALGVSGLAPDERARDLREGPGQSKGALVLEVRWAIEAGLAPLAELLDQPWRLRELGEQALRDYLGAVKPRISTSSIFANALATTKPIVSGGASASAEPCRFCGAPRVDRSKPSCRYCGASFT